MGKPLSPIQFLVNLCSSHSDRGFSPVERCWRVERKPINI
jgi:hypothetical protein